MQFYGKLVVVEAGGSPKEYLLAKETITVGRAYDNDIILSDPKASRYHGEFRRTDGQYEIVDLGSTNGTRIGSERIQRRVLPDGTTVRIGASELRFQMSAAGVPPPAREETGTIEITLAEIAVPRLVVYAAGKTREVLLGAKPVTIGRGPENEIVIDEPKVSRRHARIEKEGDEFLVVDLGSTNGSWVQGERVQRRLLQDNDTVQIGSARIFFKAGLRAAYQPPKERAEPAREEAPSRPRRPKRPMRYPVVFIPGFMGSQLYRGSEKQWPNLSKFMGEGRTMMMPNQGLEVRGVVNEVVVVPHLLKLDAYGSFLEFLVENLGYRRGKNLLEFAYDFRMDNRVSAKALRDTIKDWRRVIGDVPIVIIAHSMGGLVARYYVECLGGKEHVGHLITMGTPHFGTPKSILSLLYGASPLPRGLMAEKSRRVLLTYPSMYQLIPTYPAVYDDLGQPADMFQDEGWLPKRYRPLLRDGKAFREEMGSQCSVPATCIFGYGHSTLTRATVVGRAGRRWTADIQFEYDDEGDGTVPTRSAVIEGAEVHPVRQAHGALYSDRDVKMRLRYELMERMNV